MFSTSSCHLEARGWNLEGDPSAKAAQDDSCLGPAASDARMTVLALADRLDLWQSHLRPDLVRQSFAFRAHFFIRRCDQDVRREALLREEVGLIDLAIFALMSERHLGCSEAAQLCAALLFIHVALRNEYANY